MFVFLQVKIPCKPNDILTDAQMTQFLQTVCRTCNSCENLITLDPGPEQCEKCAADEQREALREQEEEAKRLIEMERREKLRQNQLKKSIKYESESDSSNSDRPLKYTIRKIKNEYAFESDKDNDNELMTIGVSDVESTEEQEENVSSTTAPAITTSSTTTTTTTTGTTSLTSTAKILPTGPPQEWSVEGVINFIADTDPALAVHAELFRKHVSFISNANLMITNKWPYSKNPFRFAGNRWQGSVTSQFGHDDEIYGYEIGSCAKNLQHCESNYTPKALIILLKVSLVQKFTIKNFENIFFFVRKVRKYVIDFLASRMQFSFHWELRALIAK